MAVPHASKDSSTITLNDCHVLDVRARRTCKRLHRVCGLYGQGVAMAVKCEAGDRWHFTVLTFEKVIPCASTLTLLRLNVSRGDDAASSCRSAWHGQQQAWRRPHRLASSTQHLRRQRAGRFSAAPAYRALQVPPQERRRQRSPCLVRQRHSLIWSVGKARPSTSTFEAFWERLESTWERAVASPHGSFHESLLHDSLTPFPHRGSSSDPSMAVGAVGRPPRAPTGPPGSPRWLPGTV